MARRDSIKRMEETIALAEEQAETDTVNIEFECITSKYNEIGGFSIFKKYAEIDSAHFAYLINGIIFWFLFFLPWLLWLVEVIHFNYLIFENGKGQEWEGLVYGKWTMFWVMMFYTSIVGMLLYRFVWPAISYAAKFFGDVTFTIIYITIAFPIAILYDLLWSLLYKITGWNGFRTKFEYINRLKRDTEWITEWIANRKIKKQIKKQEQERKKQEQAKKREQARRDSILANLTPKQKEGWNTLQTLRRCYMNGFEKYVRFWDLVEEEERDGRTFKTHYDFFKYMEDRFVKKYNLPEECRMKNAKNCKYANYKVRYDD